MHRQHLLTGIGISVLSGTLALVVGSAIPDFQRSPDHAIVFVLAPCTLIFAAVAAVPPVVIARRSLRRARNRRRIIAHLGYDPGERFFSSCEVNLDLGPAQFETSRQAPGRQIPCTQGHA